MILVGSVKLYDGDSPNNGVAMYYNNDQWGTICDTNIDVEDYWPSIFCHVFGYDHASSVEVVNRENKTEHISLHNPVCIHTTASDMHSCHSDTQCGHMNDVRIECEREYFIVILLHMYLYSTECH